MFGLIDRFGYRGDRNDENQKFKIDRSARISEKSAEEWTELLREARYLWHGLHDDLEYLAGISDTLQNKVRLAGIITQLHALRNAMEAAPFITWEWLEEGDNKPND